MGHFLFVIVGQIIYVCDMKKPRLYCRVRQTTQDELQKEAELNGRKLSGHVDEVLTKHVEKNERVKHTPKKEL